MKPHYTKDDRLCNLNSAVRELKAMQSIQRNSDSLIREFNNKPLFERQSLYCKYKGSRKAHLCFITDSDKYFIMKSFV